MIKPHAWSSPARLRNFTSGVFILFLISSLIFSGLLSTNFVGVSAQTDNNSLQSRTDDRANQTLDNAKKLRQVPGEKVPNQYIVGTEGYYCSRLLRLLRCGPRLTKLEIKVHSCVMFMSMQ